MAEMKQFGIDLELDDAVAQGHYSNLAIISHSTSEFIIDFATVLPEPTPDVGPKMGQA